MTDGIFGPCFKNPDDINKYWYQVTEKELEEDIEQTKKDSEDTDNSKKDREIYKQRLKNSTNELNNLQSFVDNYNRCTERYKFDKKILQQVQNDWQEYNISLYTNWSVMQIYILSGAPKPSDDELQENRRRARHEEIKREEIMKRIKDLPSK